MLVHKLRTPELTWYGNQVFEDAAQIKYVANFKPTVLLYILHIFHILLYQKKRQQLSLFQKKRVSIPVAYAKAVATFWILLTFLCCPHSQIKTNSKCTPEERPKRPKKKRNKSSSNHQLSGGGSRNVNPPGNWHLLPNGIPLGKSIVPWRVASGSPCISSNRPAVRLRDPRSSWRFLAIFLLDKKSQFWKVQTMLFFSSKKEVIETWNYCKFQ